MDSNELLPHSEFTIQEMGWTASVLGLFACTLPADATDDGQVNVADINAVAADWRNPAFAPRHDVDGDGDVDIGDIALVIADWGRACAAVAPAKDG